MSYMTPSSHPLVAPSSRRYQPITTGALLRVIETMTPDDGWLTSSSQTSDSNTMDVDDPDEDGEGEGEGEGDGDGENERGGDVDEGPAAIRYIKPIDHPALKILRLGNDVARRSENTTFVIPHEYTVVLCSTLSRVNSPDRLRRDHFFLTGQPGIGNWAAFSLRFALKHCVGQARPSAKTQQIPNEWPEIDAAICASWVIDVEGDFNPPEIFKRARGRLGDPRAIILQKMEMGGPVARSLFGLQETSTNETLKTFIKKALTSDLFALEKQLAHRVFLVQPLVVRDESSGLPHLQRTDYYTEFLSAHIAQTALDLAQDQLEGLQAQLPMALDTDATRSVAGKLVEGLMHRALTRDGIKLPSDFRPAAIATTLELIGKPGSLCNPHGPHPSSAVPPAAILYLCRRGRHPRDARQDRPHPNLSAICFIP
ncbi:hypothetical protein C8R44DRAFT_851666 [Mycena epipterygia]|nr:hypothetical protein C8R44DRAFT_851666 [Mycena epipterygia]